MVTAATITIILNGNSSNNNNYSESSILLTIVVFWAMTYFVLCWIFCQMMSDLEGLLQEQKFNVTKTNTFTDDCSYSVHQLKVRQSYTQIFLYEF